MVTFFVDSIMQLFNIFVNKLYPLGVEIFGFPKVNTFNWTTMSKKYSDYWSPKISETLPNMYYIYCEDEENVSHSLVNFKTARFFGMSSINIFFISSVVFPSSF